MHGVKRLFAWMIHASSSTRFTVSLVSLRKMRLCRRDARRARHRYRVSARSKFDPATLTRSSSHRPQADRHPAPAWLWRDDVWALAGAIRGLTTILHEHANLTDTPWFQKVADRLLEPYTDIALAVSKSTDRRLSWRADGPRREGEGGVSRRNRSMNSAAAHPGGNHRPQRPRARHPRR
jgi:hypothetical protein